MDWFKKKTKKDDAAPPAAPGSADKKRESDDDGRFFGRWDDRDPNCAEVKWEEHESKIGSRRRMGEKLEYARWMKSHKILRMPTKTPDGEYEVAAKKFEDLEAAVVASGLQLCKYQKALSKSSGAMLLLKTAFNPKGMTTDIAPPGAEKFLQAAETMKSNLDNKLIGAMETRVLMRLLDKALAMDGVIKQMLKRAIAKCEYDYYFEKYRGLQERGADTEKAKERLVRNQQNVQTSMSELKRMTGPLMATFEKYQGLGDSILQAEFETFKAAHQVYFSLTSQTFDKLESRQASSFAMPTVDAMAAELTSKLSFSNKTTRRSGHMSPDSDEEFEARQAGSRPAPAPAPAAPEPEPEGKKYQAMYDYETTEEDELALKRMDIILVTDDSDASWWRGEIDGREGLFPANYVEPFTGL